VGDPGTTFSVWAPAADRVTLELDGAAGPALEPVAATGPWAGWWRTTVAAAGHGTRYRYVLDGGDPLPDPASAWQPDGVHGASAVVDVRGFGTGFEWTDTAWRGLDLADTVVYELHVGTFTPEGTFDGAIAQLPRLVALGVTAIEVMPVGAFPGTRNWGYDGVFPWAVQESYGGPAGLARFVDAAHGHGLAVLLDVVFNHVGPEGSVHRRFGPYFTDVFHNPWGDAFNVTEAGSDAVRAYFVGAVRRWIRDFHLDGLRLDAVHSLPDPTANPVWEQIAAAAHEAGAMARRRVLVVGETDMHDPRQLHAPDRGGWGFDAVWADDVRHTIAVATLGERHDHLVDFDGTPDELADTITHRWKWRGQWSPSRGRAHGRPVDDVAPRRMVVCFENHDQVGNRPAGERVLQHTSARRMAAAVTVLLPSTPLLFMGEEYADPAPFPYFVDHQDPELLEAVRQGRRDEFAGADWSGEVPDPADPATFATAILQPALAEREPHRSVLAMYTELLRLRRTVPSVAGDAVQQVACHGSIVTVDRRSGTDRSVLAVNLAGEPAAAGLDAEELRVVFDTEDPAFGGAGERCHLAAGTLAMPPWSAALLVS
jgi:maltooligosyltrehalose trehalohydrolase